jgi:hypothetical protein
LEPVAAVGCYWESGLAVGAMGRSHGCSAPCARERNEEEKEGELGQFQEETRIGTKLNKRVGNSFLFSNLSPICKSI